MRPGFQQGKQTLAQTLKTFLDKALLLEKGKKKIKSECVNLRGEINKAEYPFFLNCRFKGFHEKLTTPMM